MTHRGVRAAGGGAARGRCSVCGTLQRLLITNGKVVLHGRTVDNPQGCAGGYQPPVRVSATGQPVTGGTVVGFTPGQDGPTAQGDPHMRQEQT